jgi:anti-sigma-K factor RskA
MTLIVSVRDDHDVDGETDAVARVEPPGSSPENRPAGPSIAAKTPVASSDPDKIRGDS